MKTKEQGTKKEKNSSDKPAAKASPKLSPKLSPKMSPKLAPKLPKLSKLAETSKTKKNVLRRQQMKDLQKRLPKKRVKLLQTK